MGAAMKLMGLDAQAGAAPVGKVREGARTLLRSVNAGVLDATGGLLDAKTLAAGALTIAALRSKAKLGWRRRRADAPLVGVESVRSTGL